MVCDGGCGGVDFAGCNQPDAGATTGCDLPDTGAKTAVEVWTLQGVTSQTQARRRVWRCGHCRV
eukprot:336777-Chlamydomonas_euryale.AAC.1